MTLCDIIRTNLDEAGASTFWPASHIYDAANEAMLDYWAASKMRPTAFDLPLAIATDICSFPSGLMIPQYILGTPPGATVAHKYFPTSHARLEQWSRTWRNEPLAYPKAFVLWDAQHFRVWPRPAAEYTFEVWGIAWPTEIGASTEDPITDDNYLKRIIAAKATSNLLEATLPQLARAFEAEAEEGLKRYNIGLRNRGGAHHPNVMRPANQFQVTQKGDIWKIREYR